MFDDTPVSERHAAIGIFTAIGMAGAAAFCLLVTGGFAPIMAERKAREPTPQSLQVQVVDARWTGPAYRPVANVQPVSYAVEGDSQYGDHFADEPLEGGARGSSRVGDPAARSYDEVSRDIEALYANTAVYRGEVSYEEASTSDHTDAVTTREADASEAEKDTLSAYGSASPW